MVVVVGTIVIVIVAVAIGVLIEAKTPKLVEPARRPLPRHAAGEAPATALRIREPQIANLRASQRCTSCRAELVPTDDDRVQYDGRELLVLHFRCDACAASRTLYIDRVS